MRRTLLISLMFAFSFSVDGQIPGPIAWPTSNPAFMEGEDVSTFIQPTVSGRVSSGLYGCVRNNGTRFHEGIDLFPIFRKSNGEADEPVYAIMKGRVVYRNDVASRSSYGRYVVLEHPEADVAVYSLYSHLASVDKAIPVGTQVEAGTVLGQLGRSAGGYTIPKERAHLHFEIGVRLSEGFDGWYEEQDYENPNYFGIWNGMNLSGMDPLAFYIAVRNKSFTTFRNHIKAQTKAVTLRYYSSRIPDFADRYLQLVNGALDPSGSLLAWDIAFTQYGMPVSLTPIYVGQVESKKAGTIELLRMEESLISKTECWRTLVKKGSNYEVGRFLSRYLKLMFEY